MQKTIISITQAVPRQKHFEFETPVSWKLKKGENWAIVGPNGAGKTIFSNLISGKLPLKEGNISYCFSDGRPIYEQIRSAAFLDIYTMTDNKTTYYQQRWNSSDKENSPQVSDVLKRTGKMDKLYQFISHFEIEDILEKRLIYLSSGELRKFLIVNILLSEPKVLILDNPYIGLDAESRALLNELLKKIIQHNIQIILLLSDPDDIPDITTHILPVYRQSLLTACVREVFLQNEALKNYLFPPVFFQTELPLVKTDVPDYKNTLHLQNIHVKYGEKTILENLCWTVEKGEKWVLSGPNGSGKSTLLSLVYADNPQAYANAFYLFDKKRGSGESIWDIKKRIGYVSPEIHLYFKSNQIAVQIVASGFFDSIGLYRKCSESQLKQALEWMEVFEISHLAEKQFSQLSFGEQRMVILVRAFVKNPELLILDEPMHGLDKSNKNKVSAILDVFCQDNQKTLIYVTHYMHEVPGCVTKNLTLVKT